MYYEINVSRGGKHFFATAERSCTTLQDCQQVLKALLAAFPSSEGYHITVTKWQQVGYPVALDDVLPILETTVPCSHCGHRVPKGEICICQRSAESCPGCGCEPGEGETAECDHPEGCGFYRGLEPPAAGGEQ